MTMDQVRLVSTSITQWISLLKAGDDQAAEQLWGEYYRKLVGVARNRLGAFRDAVVDEEDVALSAFKSLCLGAKRGVFPRLDDRDNLWRLLVVITKRKAADAIKREQAQKRAGAIAREPLPLDEIAGGRAADEIVILNEEFNRLLDALGSETLKQVALWKLEGLGHDEIAEKLGCARRTVARKLDLIRQCWTADLSDFR